MNLSGKIKSLEKMTRKVFIQPQEETSSNVKGLARVLCGDNNRFEELKSRYKSGLSLLNAVLEAGRANK